MKDTLSRRLARWLAGLTFHDLPDEVIDRAKGMTLQALSSALLGSQTVPGGQAIDIIAGSEAGAIGGASILVTGQRATTGGAAFANTQLISAGGKWDTFRMLVHPGTSVIPAALAAAEETDASGEQFITAVAAGYEVLERLAGDVIPSVAARGFNCNLLFGIFGAAVAAGKLYGLNEDQLNTAIALCVSMASGNFENNRGGGRGIPGVVVRDGILAAVLARSGQPGGETTLEGDAGFFHSYLGNNRGELHYSFSGENHADLDSIAERLGEHWLFLETLYRIYSISGYNLAPVELTAQLCAEYDIGIDEIEGIEAVVNWLETCYPSPAFSGRREDHSQQPGSTAYYIACAAAAREFSVTRPWGAKSPWPDDPAEAPVLSARVTILPSTSAPLFAPRITISTIDGRRYARQGSGREFAWTFEEHARRIRDLQGSLPIATERFAEMTDACRRLPALARTQELVAFTQLGQG